MTKRQWTILQQGLSQLDGAIHADHSGGWIKMPLCWDPVADGPPPTHEEMAAVADLVGRMGHDGRDDDVMVPECPPHGQALQPNYGEKS